MLGGPVEILDRCETSRGELILQQRGSEYEIISNGTFLMATYNGESERVLVRAALAAVDGVAENILIGGLGVGFSLQEALRSPHVARVEVVEIEPKIIEWNQSRLGSVARAAMADGRTAIRQQDVLDWLRTDALYDAVCLDVDNGSDWTVFEENHGLYTSAGLTAIYDHVRPGGAVSFWNARHDAAFLQRLRRQFGHVAVTTVPHPTGLPDVVYVASRGRLG